MLEERLEPENKDERDLCKFAEEIYNIRDRDTRKPELAQEYYCKNFQSFILSAYRNEKEGHKIEYYNGIKEMRDYYVNEYGGG